jgi:hypothetical protein
MKAIGKAAVDLAVDVERMISEDFHSVQTRSCRRTGSRLLWIQAAIRTLAVANNVDRAIGNRPNAARLAFPNIDGGRA